MASLAKTNVERMCRLNEGQAKAKTEAQARNKVVREKNAELMVRLASLEQAGDMAGAVCGVNARPRGVFSEDDMESAFDPPPPEMSENVQPSSGEAGESKRRYTNELGR
jgi:hypothetical protein